MKYYEQFTKYIGDWGMKIQQLIVGSAVPEPPTRTTFSWDRRSLDWVYGSHAPLKHEELEGKGQQKFKLRQGGTPLTSLLESLLTYSFPSLPKAKPTGRMHDLGQEVRSVAWIRNVYSDCGLVRGNGTLVYIPLC